jgi:hypothetical protein
VQSRGVLKTPEAGVTHAVIRANATVSLVNTSFWSPVRESGWFSSSNESSAMPGRPIAPQNTRMSIVTNAGQTGSPEPSRTPNPQDMYPERIWFVRRWIQRRVLLSG